MRLRQANFECNFEGKSLYDTVVNCASIDFLLHVITNPKCKKAITINSRSKARAHLSAIWYNGQEISRVHLATIECNGLTGLFFAGTNVSSFCDTQNFVPSHTYHPRLFFADI